MCFFDLPKTSSQTILADTRFDQPTIEEQCSRGFDAVPVSSIKEVTLCGCGSQDISNQQDIALNNNVLKAAAYEVERDMLVAKGANVEEVITNELMRLNISASMTSRTSIFQASEATAFAVFLKTASFSKGGTKLDCLHIELSNKILSLSLMNFSLESGFSRLWPLLFKLDEDVELFRGWVSLLSLVLQRCNDSGITPRQAFYQQLYSHIEYAQVAYGVESDEVLKLQATYDNLLLNNCFFPLLP